MKPQCSSIYSHANNSIDCHQKSTLPPICKKKHLTSTIALQVALHIALHLLLMFHFSFVICTENIYCNKNIYCARITLRLKCPSFTLSMLICAVRIKNNLTKQTKYLINNKLPNHAIRIEATHKMFVFMMCPTGNLPFLVFYFQSIQQHIFLLR